ncbi:hypothetical protein H6G97_17205 [Nostoc flagelliforme FACHB-838]|uniref:Lipopolysaccharide biosynthesis protein n=1 Tax=Nostoc flagelliforme FACHB-838 TaxID=2692904 RepID=A0ABR8DQQ0_9NOSO|nr:hypothetical protein [Nostoc flagelliforme]MBD2531230.1 hypothetical protein [Nostoc flagelliforme FACHB-838]
MSDFTVIHNSRSHSTWRQKSWKLYLPIWLLANGMIWSGALLYLKKTPPTYSSEWKIILPGAKSSTNITLPGIGEASSSSDSPYSSQSSDPRQNYKYLAETNEVLQAAANHLNMSVEKFGKPQIKILDNTNLMQFEIKGDTPEQSQKKALALNKALEEKLDQLRKEEIIQQNRRLQAVLSGAEQKLQVAQKRLSNYKAQSGLSATEQLRDVSVNLEGLRRQRAETLAQLEQVTARFRQLSASLGLSSQEAVDALVLQSNPSCQQYLAQYSKVSAELASLSAKYLPTHPAVITKQMEKDATSTALIQKAQSLLGRPVSQATIEQLTLSSGGSSSSSSSERAVLFQELISFQGQQKGFQAQAQELGKQTAELESRLTNLSQKESQLDSLQRNVRIGEAVFSSTLTRLDLSNSNISASYPSMSVLSKPSLPEEPSSPKRKFVLLGTSLGSFFLTTGIVSLGLVSSKSRKVKSDV